MEESKKIITIKNLKDKKKLLMPIADFIRLDEDSSKTVSTIDEIISKTQLTSDEDSSDMYKLRVVNTIEKKDCTVFYISQGEPKCTFQSKIHGKIIHKNGTKYFGSFRLTNHNKGVVYSGKGIETFSSGEKYFGYFLKGLYHGKGKYFFKDSSKYDGEWKNGEKHGEGVFYHNKEGEVFKGCWKNGKKAGEGTYTWGDGSVFVGDFQNDLKDGHGKMKYKNHKVLKTYMGFWKNGKKNGRGTLRYTNGNVYNGYFKDDKRDGQGTLTYNMVNRKEVRSYYEGDFKNDEIEGKGKISYKNKDFFRGYVKNNKKSGKGIMKYSNGDVYDGNWKNDKKNGFGEMKWREKLVKEKIVPDFVESSVKLNLVPMEYCGTWKDGKMDGKGKMLHFGGTSFDGYFKNNEMAFGRLIFYEGKIGDENSFTVHYEGGFLNNQRHSARNTKSTLCYFNKYLNLIKQVIGPFVDDKLNGKCDEKYFDIRLNKNLKSEEPNETSLREKREKGSTARCVKQVYRYIGMFKNGVKSGKGIAEYSCYEPDGRKLLEGEWKNGSFFSGTITFESGVKKKFCCYSETELREKDNQIKMLKVANQNVKNSNSNLNKKLISIKEKNEIFKTKDMEKDKKIGELEKVILEKEKVIKSCQKTISLTKNECRKKLKEFQKEIFVEKNKKLKKENDNLHKKNVTLEREKNKEINELKRLLEKSNKRIEDIKNFVNNEI